MKSSITINAAQIIERSMNHIDLRLMHHGKRVGFFVYRVLRNKGYSDAQLRDFILLGILHDVGAFKTEELDKMVHFETNDVWGHSIYGYLFMKYFSPMRSLAPVLLYHHSDVAQSACLSPEAQKLALLIHLCDRADLFYLGPDGYDDFCIYLSKKRGTRFTDEVVDLFIDAKIQKADVIAMESDADFNRILYETPMSNDAALAFMRMVIYSIDFRSPQTMLHTFALRLVARKLAEIMGMDEESIVRIETAALLHDIGKMGTPLSILEGTHKLTNEEYAVMQQHVIMSEEILIGCINEDILQMAINHHERVDGTGYPKQIPMANRPAGERLMAVADVLSALLGSRSYKQSFPKERVLSILEKMRGNHLDATMVDLAIDHYDTLCEVMAQHTAPIEEMYNTIEREQAAINAMVNKGEFDFTEFFADCYA